MSSSKDLLLEFFSEKQRWADNISISIHILQKFLIDKNGKVVKRYAPTSNPLSIASDIQNYI